MPFVKTQVSTKERPTPCKHIHVGQPHANICKVIRFAVCWSDSYFCVEGAKDVFMDLSAGICIIL